MVVIPYHLVAGIPVTDAALRVAIYRGYKPVAGWREDNLSYRFKS